MTTALLTALLSLFPLTEYRLSAYTASCKGCTGITASGVRPVEGVTAACPRRLPFGTRITLYWPRGSRTVVCHDRGGSIVANRLDIFFKHRADAIAFGRRTVAGRVEK